MPGFNDKLSDKRSKHMKPTRLDTVDRRFSVAPMMDFTDRYCRYFHRLLSRHTLLYTEMITTGAILHGDSHQHLKINTCEHPIALQLGGSNPVELALSCKQAARYHYDEINLNCGCPSDRVQSGQFGATLMKTPKLVAECFKSMQDAVEIPVTIKHRIGVDDMESYPFLQDFVGSVANVGCKTFIVHARKAWLKGLSPKQNREIPPLDYETVYQLKRDFPDLEIILNGGITTLDEAEAHMQYLDGVMVGREAYHNPYILSEVDRRFYHDNTLPPTRTQVLEQFTEFMASHLENSELNPKLRLNHMTRHILGLYQGMPGARKFRRFISENAHKPGADIDVIYDALSAMNLPC